MVIILALLGRFCISAVFAVIILQTSELFPTVNRNSAIGTSLTICQLGAIAAPYIVDGLVCKICFDNIVIFLASSFIYIENNPVKPFENHG